MIRSHGNATRCEAQARRWARQLEPAPRLTMRSTRALPGGSALARAAEAALPGVLPWGTFLAVVLRKPGHDE
jgi:hypothetical protein